MKTLNWNERTAANWQTKRAYEAYSATPNLCQICGSCIWPQPRPCGITQARMQVTCSLSCASKTGHLKHHHVMDGPKHEKGWARKSCPVCNSIMTWNASRCRRCRFAHEREAEENRTWQDIKEKRGTNAAHAYVRAKARKKFETTWFEKRCVLCSFEGVAEIAHIKAVGSFPDTALLGKINSKENLIPLCPNCHFAFDAGRIAIETIKAAKIALDSLISM